MTTHQIKRHFTGMPYKLKYTPYALLFAILCLMQCTPPPGSSDAGVFKHATFSSPHAGAITVPYSYYTADYGTDGLQTLDLFIPHVLPAGNPSHPILMHIHGGGFASGNKDNIYTQANKMAVVAEALNHGLAFVNINYRLLNNSDGLNVLDKCLADVRYSLQFIRYYANTPGINLNKDKVVLWGSSAGASSAFYLAFSDEMSTATMDPVTSESTRVRAVWAQQTQATLDLEEWPGIFTNVPTDPIGTISLTLGNILDILGRPRVRAIYGIPTGTNISTWLAANQPMLDQLDFLNAIGPDDPPFWITHEYIPEELPNDVTLIPDEVLNHHPYHSKALLNQATGVITVYARIDKLGIDNTLSTPYETREAIDFLIDVAVD